MKLTVLGATGGTGQHVVRQALDAGHHVTAVVRDPARLPVGADPRLEVVVADAFDPDSIAAAVSGRDAVIDTLGPRPKTEATVCSRGAAAVVAAMSANNPAARLLVVTGNGHARDAGDGPFTRYVIKPLIGNTVLKKQFDDFARTERLVFDSKLRWTVLRPPQLTDGGRKPYRTAVDRNVRGGFRLSRADLADAIMVALGDPRTVGRTVGLGY
ncbi:NADH-flavin reductase [Asanoa ishikariensis]|uniref:Putative NADH-flavin reductase n=1 Tax=Asanoa ishikariensis TaxID=137265 RepID=A0A1H3QNI9_9ACTN|nr:NAD(P)H-binding protein [Asanoa ishikariensis]GIF64834.1 NADH-flavin reductase [Asanoa ishikariensis]SDZ15134.1 Putative NADH-flavin reductase [Asanoa ishikariensis]